jgi:enoyl-CoA hydratase/carnithine racemase
MLRPESLSPTGRQSSIPPGRPEAGVTVEDSGAIREVILDRRSKKNAITIDMYRKLTAALEGAARDPGLHVVQFSSSGGAFSVGSDVSELSGDSSDPAHFEEFASAVRNFLLTLVSFPKAIVAAVNGLARGMGATMLLHCDVVVASPFAAFEFSSAKLATGLDATSGVLLGARVGLQRASEWLLFGERVDASTLLQLGLVNGVVPLENLAGSVRARAEALASLPQQAVCETKRLLREPLRAAVGDAIARELHQ